MFYKGIIEGFYGRPWTHKQRIKLLFLLKKLHLNTYLYAPKNDLLHRKHWRNPYPKKLVAEFQELGRIAKKNNLLLAFSLSPGLAITYSDAKDRNILIQKYQQMQQAGFNAFALLVDDIPEQLNKEDSKHFTSLAEAHTSLANYIYEKLSCRHFFLCPTYYSYERTKNKQLLKEHLKELGEELNPDIQVFWTGDQTIAEKITPTKISPIKNFLRRQPVIWDNYFADDYTTDQIFLGPLYGRSPTLPKRVNGFLCNPSQYIEVACRSLISTAAYLNKPDLYNPKHIYRQMLEKTAGAKYQGYLNAIADFYHGPFIRTTFITLLRKLVINSKNEPKSCLEQFQKIKQIKYLAKIWELEGMTNNELYLNLFPYAIRAYKIVKVIHTYLLWRNGDLSQQAKIVVMLQRIGITPNAQKLETIILALIP